MHRSIRLIALATLVLLANDVAAATAPVELHLLHSVRESLTRGSDSYGVFTPDGPRLGTLRPAPSRVDFVTCDVESGTWYGQQTSTFGTIDDAGGFTEIEPPPSVSLSHTGGLAFDAERGTVLVTSKSGAGTVVYEYAPGDGTWTEVGNLGRERLLGLACDGREGTIFTLEQARDVEGCARLHVHNRHGARILTTTLSTPIPVFSSLHAKVQLAFEGGSLYALTSHYAHPRVANALYRIDPASGRVSRAPWNASLDLTSATWPGWEGGPPPSKPMAARGARGEGVYSCYDTPASIVSSQPAELHVVAIGSGAVNYLEWLKKVKKVSASAEGGTVSVELELELDPDAETQPPVVEIEVGPSAKPLTLILAAGGPVTWSIDAAPGADLARVITFDSPYMGKSRVMGIDAGLVVDGGAGPAVYAWELERASIAVGFDEMIAQFRETTGLRERSFQGLLRAEALRVPAGDVSVSSVP